MYDSTNLFISLATAFGSWFAVTGATWKLFERIEKAATDEAKQEMYKWISGLRVDSHINAFAGYLADSFRWVFGEKIVSFKYIARSSIASVSTALIVLLLWISYHPNEAREIWNNSFIFALGSLGLWLTLFNLLPDYISLIQTEAVISRLKRGHTVKSLLAWIAVDFLLTISLAISTWVVLIPIFQVLATGDFREGLDSLLDVPYVVWNVAMRLSTEPAGKLPIGIVFYSTFLTSAWLWIYILSLLVAKLAISISRIYAKLTKYLVREDQPFIGLGVISVLVITLCYILYIPFAMLHA